MTTNRQTGLKGIGLVGILVTLAVGLPALTALPVAKDHPAVSLGLWITGGVCLSGALILALLFRRHRADSGHEESPPALSVGELGKGIVTGNRFESERVLQVEKADKLTYERNIQRLPRRRGK